MMKNLFIVVTVLSAHLAFGQQQYPLSKKIEFTPGPVYQGSLRSGVQRILGSDNSGYYAFKTEIPTTEFGKAHYELAHFDNNLLQTKSIELTFEHDGKDMTYEGLIFVRQRLFLLTSFINKKLEKNFLFLREIDKNSLKPSKEIRKIAEIDVAEADKGTTGYFKTTISPDSSKVMVYYEHPFIKKINERFGFHVFEADFLSLWQKDISLPYEDELGLSGAYGVANNGDAFITRRIKDSEQKNRDKRNDLLIVSVAHDGDSVKEIRLRMGDHLMVRTHTAFHDGEIIAIGTYADEEIAAYGVTGYFIHRINQETQTISLSHFEKFPFELVVKLYSKKQLEYAEDKRKKCISSFILLQYRGCSKTSRWLYFGSGRS